MPQRVEPAAARDDRQRAVPSAEKGRKGWWFAAVAAALILVAALVAVALYATRDTPPTPEEQIRSSIDTFVEALRTGDIQALRSNSCGPLAEYYKSIKDEEFAQIYQDSVDHQIIPVVQSVDAIQIAENNTAIAQATVYTRADPSNRTARTFNLEERKSGA